MIRTQVVKILCSLDGQEPKWHEFFVHREHAFGGDTHVACSEVLICPQCGQIWARLKFLDDSEVWPRPQTCELCTYRDDWLPVPGSLLVEEGYGVIDDALLTSLPDPLVIREFNLHLKVYQS